MRTSLLLALALPIGCGESGEPIKGDIAIAYGSDHPDLKVGSVIEPADMPGKMLVQIGTTSVDCDTNLDEFSFNFPKGTYVFFTVDQATGAFDSAFVNVMKSSKQNISINSSSGDIVIDAIDPRVTGSLTFDTTDDDVGTISVSGSFDVIRCF